MKNRLHKGGVKSVILIIMVFGIGLTFLSNAQAEEKEIVWAIVDAFTGGFAPDAEEGYKATALYMEEHNFKMGPYKVRIVTRDNELKPAVAVRRLQELMAETKPLILSSGLVSSIQLAMADVIGKTKHTIFWCDGWDTRITGTLGNRYTFRWNSPGYTTARSGMVSFLKKFPEIKTAVLFLADYAFGYDMGENAEEVFNQRGVKVLKKIFYPVTAPDFGVYMTEAKTLNPDAFCFMFQALCLKQAHEYGLKKQMKVLCWGAHQRTIKGLGSEVIDGVYFTSPWYHSLTNSWTRQFVEKYTNRWGHFPSDYGAQKYLECQLTDRVIRETGSIDPKVLIPALEKIGEFDGPSGKEYMASWQHQVIHDEYFFRAKSPSEKKHEEDYLQLLEQSSRVFPKQGEKGFDFDRTKEPL